MQVIILAFDFGAIDEWTFFIFDKVNPEGYWECLIFCVVSDFGWLCDGRKFVIDYVWSIWVIFILANFFVDRDWQNADKMAFHYLWILIMLSTSRFREEKCLVNLYAYE